MQATIKAIEYYLPSDRLTNEDLAHQFPDWPATKIEEKTGIQERRIASIDECSSDLAVCAAEKLLRGRVVLASRDRLLASFLYSDP